MRSRPEGPRALRVTHCPVNTAGIPWANSQALRRRGVESDLLVFERYRLHPEADWSLDRRGGLARRQLAQWRAFARLLPQTDVFHFYFGLTLVPAPLEVFADPCVSRRTTSASGSPESRSCSSARPRWSRRCGS